MVVAPPVRVEAELLERELTSGRNKAVVIAARTQGGDAVQCVVKFADRLKGMAPAAYLFEWVATAVARALGVSVPEPFAVNVSLEFATAIKDTAAKASASKSCGLAFGCTHLKGPLTQWIPGLAAHTEVREAATELLAFDIYIHNPDRRRDNPNILVQRDRVIAIDHDLAFAFCFPPTFLDPVTDPLLSVLEKHACGQPLKGKLADLTGFRARLAGLTDAWFADLAEATPAEWKVGNAAGKLDRIVAVLRNRRDCVAEWLPVVEGRMA